MQREPTKSVVDQFRDAVTVLAGNDERHAIAGPGKYSYGPRTSLKPDGQLVLGESPINIWHRFISSGPCGARFRQLGTDLSPALGCQLVKDPIVCVSAGMLQLVLATFSARHNEDGWIQTFSGIRFWPLDPDPDDIRIEDIAHSLASQCRFGGHCREFYSVGQHSVIVSQCCLPADALWGLLHDASEAYLTDIPRPLKRLPAMTAYRDAELHLQRIIAVHFGLGMDQPASVTEADDRMLVLELQSELMAGAPPLVSQPIESRIQFCDRWPPGQAEARFLARFHELSVTCLQSEPQ